MRGKARRERERLCLRANKKIGEGMRDIPPTYLYLGTSLSFSHTRKLIAKRMGKRKVVKLASNRKGSRSGDNMLCGYGAHDGFGHTRTSL